MSISRDNVRNYYKNYEEEDRLNDRHKRPDGVIEFETTVKILNEEIEKLKATRTVGEQISILDACAGTGAYSLYYANRPDCKVTATDLSQDNLNKLFSTIMNNMTDNINLTVLNPTDVTELSRRLEEENEDNLMTEKYDVVMIMGALYHLSDLQDRLTAIEEAKRVLKPDGILVTTHITRFPVLFKVIGEMPEQLNLFDEYMTTGVAPKEANSSGVFYAEKDINTIKDLFKDTNLNIKRIFGQDSIADIMRNKLSRLKQDDFEIAKKIIIGRCEDESIIGLSQHVAVISKLK